MNRFEKWYLKKLCQKIVKQGEHKERIIDYYNVLYKMARKEFTDTESELYCFLKSCFEEAAKEFV